LVLEVSGSSDYHLFKAICEESVHGSTFEGIDSFWVVTRAM